MGYGVWGMPFKISFDVLSSFLGDRGSPRNMGNWPQSLREWESERAGWEREGSVVRGLEYSPKCVYGGRDMGNGKCALGKKPTRGKEEAELMPGEARKKKLR